MLFQISEVPAKLEDSDSEVQVSCRKLFQLIAETSYFHLSGNSTGTDSLSAFLVPALAKNTKGKKENIKPSTDTSN